ncbi:hypothetical protein [Streptomyces sp. C11-1]
MGFVLGSVSTAVVSAANCPVVSVRAKNDAPAGRRDEAPYGDLIVGGDARQRREALLGFAFDEAERPGCGIRFLSAWALPRSLSTVAVKPD